MAIVYLGQNNLSKKTNNIYIGIDNQSKQVIKGYVGVNGYSKLFYKYKEEFYPILKDIWSLGTQHSISSFDFNYPSEILSGDKVDLEEKGLIRRQYGDQYYTNYSKVYLWGDCYKLFNCYMSSGPLCYDDIDYQKIVAGSIETIGPLNLEKYFLFNYAINISHLFNKETTTTNLYNVTGNLANCNFINVTDMSYAFYGCTGLTGSAQSGPKVINMSYAYFRCNNLTGSPKSGPNVINMHNTYYDCNNLTGSPVCGDKVENMVCTYYGCNNLTGSPVCGPNVTNMHYTYTNCRNLTGSPVCGPNVINMTYAYYYCCNLTGDIAIGEKVISARYAYYWIGQGASRLKLNNLHVGKYQAIDLNHCFTAANIYGDIYILNNKSNINSIFLGASSGDKKINIHYPTKYSLASLNSTISSISISSIWSGEIHTIIDGTYIDIKHNNGISTNVRIYNDYIES